MPGDLSAKAEANKEPRDLHRETIADAESVRIWRLLRDFAKGFQGPACRLPCLSIFFVINAIELNCTVLMHP